MPAGAASLPRTRTGATRRSDDGWRNPARAGAVACVERLKNPIQAARLVLECSPHVYLVGQGAGDVCAKEWTSPDRQRQPGHRPRTAAPRSSQSKSQRSIANATFGGDPAGSHDTVGAVALDADGNLAAATSTGGTLNKTPGRVGDSSVIGCGGYADNRSAAVSLTGWGEPIMKLVLGKWAVDRVPLLGPEQAAQDAIAYLYARLAGSRRHHPARPGRPLRHRSQHPAHGLGRVRPGGRPHRHPRGRGLSHELPPSSSLLPRRAGGSCWPRRAIALRSSHRPCQSRAARGRTRSASPPG